MVRQKISSKRLLSNDHWSFQSEKSLSTEPHNLDLSQRFQFVCKMQNIPPSGCSLFGLHDEGNGFYFLRWLFWRWKNRPNFKHTKLGLFSLKVAATNTNIRALSLRFIRPLCTYSFLTSGQLQYNLFKVTFQTNKRNKETSAQRD